MNGGDCQKKSVRRNLFYFHHLVFKSYNFNPVANQTPLSNIFRKKNRELPS